ncbi:hypothetical protein BD414DRAFT_466612 [Trametes punicea]|nr:hypothetical protein BD414DRAFT_466612 [Trametes punicea]
MISIGPLLYNLPASSAVKWLATQERNINRELPYTGSAAEAPEEYVSRTYLQFLWLPQSIMPLHRLVPALLRVRHASSVSPSTSQAPMVHPLHGLLQPILLTSRASSQKYHSRIPQLLAEENDPTDAEEEYMWYAYQKDKSADADVLEGQDEYEVHERLRNAWLEKMERREVQIQILLHFLLLSLQGNSASPSTDSQPDLTKPLPLPPPLSPSKSKKRGRRDRGKDKALPPLAQPLEERLETYMDKLAMWQLMQTVDNTLGLVHKESAKSAANGLDKGVPKDGRDWMQVFCEDVVEPLFKDQLPGLCALFHSKLFPDAANSDTDTADLSPPASPEPASKRPKSTASNTATAASSKAKSDAEQRARSRSRSLSISLEQEQRERSRSVSIGPGGLRKRAIVREVSMTTGFRGKQRAKSKAEPGHTASASLLGPSLSRTQNQNQSVPELPSGMRGERRAKSTILVAATPVKARTSQSQSQPHVTQARIPALFATTDQQQTSARLSRIDSLDIALEADEDVVAAPTGAGQGRAGSQIANGVQSDDQDSEWKLSSSPDALLLGASGSQDWDAHSDSSPTSSSPDDLGGLGGLDRTGSSGRLRGRVLVGDTPTKAR